MSDSTRLQLPLLAASQAQKHVTHNEAIMRLDGLVQMTALSYTTSAQPASPSDGDLYLLPAGKTGADWGGYTNHAVAHYYDGIWHQYHPNEGWLAYVQDSGVLYVYSGSQWIEAALMAANNLSDLADKAAARSNLGVEIGADVQAYDADLAALATAGFSDRAVFPTAPAINFGGAATGITYSNQNGYYTKVGKLVFFIINLTLSNKGSATGNASIENLPFTNSGFNVPLQAYFSNVNFSDPNDSLSINGGTSISLRTLVSGSSHVLQETDFNNNSIINVSGMYFAAT